MKGLAHVEVTSSTERRSRRNLMPHTSDSFVSRHTYLYNLTLRHAHTFTPFIKLTHTFSHTHWLPSAVFLYKHGYTTVLHRRTVLTVSYINRTGWIVQLRCDGHVCVSVLSIQADIRLVTGYRKLHCYFRLSLSAVIC